MQSAFITGGAKRIGKEIAIGLSKIGYNIAFTYNSSEDEANKTCKEILSNNVKCKMYKFDLSQINNIEALFKEVINDFPDISVLINSASIFQKNKIIETSNDFLVNMFNINFFAPYILTREFCKYVKKGNIINILDTKIFKNGYNYSSYLLSKKALFELTKQSALEFAPNIRVNGIAPGLILPPDGQDDKYLDKLAENIPLKRKGSSDMITKAIIYLLENDYITGQVLAIDGGQHINLGEY